METRDFAHLELRQDSDGRTLSGVAVPYGVKTPIFGSTGLRFEEEFRAGSVDTSQRPPLLLGHPLPGGGGDLPVARCLGLAERADGLYGDWRVSDTQSGRDLLTLYRDGLANSLSVGFQPNDDLDQWSADGRSVLRRGVSVDHIAVVRRGAYDGAKLLSLRSRQAQLARRSATMDGLVAWEHVRRQKILEERQVPPDDVRPVLRGASVREVLEIRESLERRRDRY